MSDFSGRTPQKIDLTIKQGGFFPDIAVGDFQELHRIPSDWREAAIKMTLVESVAFINDELSQARILCEKTNHKALSDIPTSTFDNEGELIWLYKSAVFHEAKARLLHQYATMNQRDRAEHKGRESEETSNHYHNTARGYITRLENKLFNVAAKPQQPNDWLKGEQIRVRTL